MLILYGIINSNIDITKLCFNKLVLNNHIIIPSGDFNRTDLFTDPLIGTKKSIIIINFIHY